jgi:predicted ATPase/class 3 adenylate cyclase
MAELPTGTITFLFTDIEGSTRMLQTLGDGWVTVLEEHNRLLRTAIREAGGLDVRTEGDAFFAVFRSAASAVTAAASAQRAVAAHHWPSDAPVRVRMGMHTGEGTAGGDDYVGLDVHRAARIASAAHGGQVLVSAATAELVGSLLPDGLRLHDLGKHRLKDLARPERIYQLRIDGLASQFPDIRSLETPSNLPTLRTSFVGRDRELARLKELLQGPGLLTLTGPGGSGKTRLAIRAAGELTDSYADGVFFVALAPLHDPRLIPSTVADSVGARAEGGRPVQDILKEHLRELEVLLVLDNFEQVLAGAPLVAELLDVSPRLRVLATSREPLHVSGEQELPVPPLDLPEPGGSTAPDALERYEAVALFVDRAMAVDPDFRITDANALAVAELCRRLDGLPLAIELAASRAKLLAAQAILDRLEHSLEMLTGGSVDLPARQRTLRAAIGWSYDLLDDAEQALFRRLSVFAGGWTLEAAEATSDPGGEPGTDLLDAHGSLVDKSLVTRSTAGSSGVRFGMLETIRAFAIEQLEASGEADATRDRHLAHFMDAAETAELHLRGVEQQRWLDDLEREHDNLRSALRWAIAAGHPQEGLRLAGALWRFWHLHGHLSEGRDWLVELLALPGSDERTAARAKALTALGGVSYWQEDLPTSRAAYEEALAIARELGDRPAEAEGVYNLAFLYAYEGDLPGAGARIEEARAMFEELGIMRGVADTIWMTAITTRLDGDISKARALAEESLRLHRQAEDRFGVTDALHILGRIALADGDLETAEASSLEALENDGRIGNRTGMGVVMDELAHVAGKRGQHLRALRLGGASEAVKEAAGGHAPPPFIDLPDPRVAAREALGDAVVDAAWEEGRAMTLEQAVAYARGDD